MKTRLFLLLWLWILYTVGAKAQYVVQDPFNLVQNILNVGYQGVHSAHEVTGLYNQAIQLKRLGDPNYYVNLLDLSTFQQTAKTLSSGVGQSISSYRQTADGAQALSYTANGLYANLQGMVASNGQPIQFNTSSFQKFQAVNNMVESYNTNERTYNTQASTLHSQLQTAMSNLNSASDQISTQKFAAQVSGISAQINALGHTTNLAGQRAQIQQVANQNDAARVQEAQRQAEIQERQNDLQTAAQQWSGFLGGNSQ
jgi:hypothetical protein